MPSIACTPDRSSGRLTFTVNSNEFDLVNAKLRIRYRESIYDWSASSGEDFDISQSLASNDPDYPYFNELINNNGSNELTFSLPKNTTVTFHTNLTYNPNGGINPADQGPLEIRARLMYENVTKVSKFNPKFYKSVSGNLPYLDATEPLFVTGNVVVTGSGILATPSILVAPGKTITIPSSVTIFNGS